MDEGIFFFERGGKNWYENFSQSAWGSLEYGGARVSATFKTVSYLALTGFASMGATCRIKTIWAVTWCEGSLNEGTSPKGVCIRAWFSSALEFQETQEGSGLLK